MEETDPDFVRIKIEPQSMIEQVFICNNSEFTGAYDENPTEALYDLQIKQDELKITNFKDVKIEYNEEEQEEKNTKLNIVKKEIEVKQVVFEGDRLKVNSEIIEDYEENMQIVIKSESNLWDARKDIKKEENELPQCLKEEEMTMNCSLSDDEHLMQDEIAKSKL